MVKCFWCEGEHDDLIGHTNRMHPGLSARSYDYLTEKTEEETTISKITREVAQYTQTHKKPNTIRLAKKIDNDAICPLKILGMDVLIDEKLQGDEFYLYYGELEFDIFRDVVYETRDGKFIYVKEITYYNSLFNVDKNRIAEIVTSGDTVFSGDSKTTVHRKVYTEIQFREKVRAKVC